VFLDCLVVKIREGGTVPGIEHGRAHPAVAHP
jgi:hypothetical protein